MPKVYIKTLGCKVNTYDTRAIENQFISKGYAIVDQPHLSDVNVINSCSVTNAAEKEARYLLRRYHRENPDALRVITGCYAQTQSARLATLEEVDCVVPNEVKSELITFVSKALNQSHEERQLSGKLPEGINQVKDNRQRHFKSSAVFFDKAKSDSRTRSFLKIQDGCNGFCSYCLIPYARGASSSVDPFKIIDEVNRLIGEGVKEIVLTGIHIGDYGDDLLAGDDNSRRFGLIDLLREIFKNKGLKRLRISSLEPMEVSNSLLDVLAKEKDRFCDHFHLPLQSGHDRILSLMRRSYNCSEYESTLTLIRRYFPHANLTADVIPGFPGESDLEFAATVEFIRQSGLNGLHVFPYSKRPNTAAARMPGHIEASIVKSRAAELRRLAAELQGAYARSFLNKNLTVLWEHQYDKAGRLKGKSKNYLNIVSKPSEQIQPGMISEVTLKGFTNQFDLLAMPSLTY